MAERLGHGELTMHYRRHVEGGPKQRIECGAGYGCITAVMEDVTCEKCKTVADRANALAEDCGCRNGHVHRALALALIETEEVH